MTHENLVDRAQAAYAADQEAQRLEKEAAAIRDKQEASERIRRYADTKLDVLVATDDIYENGSAYEARISLTEDATLVIVDGRPSPRDGDETTWAHIKPAEQLYWDLPPNQTEKETGGGTYGCYGLSLAALTARSLADVGAALLKIDAARIAWKKKHIQT